MKKIILNFKKTIRFLVSIIVSSEFAFVYILLGTISQVAHTYFLLENISSLQGNWKIFQAVILSIFISSSLLYWVAISDDEDTTKKGIEAYKRANFAIWLFTIIEILINIYYYSKHLVIDAKEFHVYEFIFALMIACLIPLTIKLFSANIKAKNWILEFEENNINKNSDNEQTVFDEEKILELIKPLIGQFEKSIDDIDELNQEKVNRLIDAKLSELNDSIEKQIGISFSKQQDLFLKQFENRLKILSEEYLNKQK